MAYPPKAVGSSVVPSLAQSGGRTAPPAAAAAKKFMAIEMASRAAGYKQAARTARAPAVLADIIYHNTFIPRRQVLPAQEATSASETSIMHVIPALNMILLLHGHQNATAHPVPPGRSHVPFP